MRPTLLSLVSINVFYAILTQKIKLIFEYLAEANLDLPHPYFNPSYEITPTFQLRTKGFKVVKMEDLLSKNDTIIILAPLIV